MTTPQIERQPSAYEAFSARYKADPADPMCWSDLLKYTDGWDDACAAVAAPLRERIAELEAALQHIEGSAMQITVERRVIRDAARAALAPSGSALSAQGEAG